MSKVMPLGEAIARIPDGAAVAVGGNTFHRAPGAALHELVRQGRKGLTLIKTAGAYDVDLLVGAGVVARATIAYAGFETMGLSPQFRRAVELGRLALWEHT
jgi:glutaconate CoA-transferase, subunit A